MWLELSCYFFLRGFAIIHFLTMIELAVISPWEHGTSAQLIIVRVISYKLSQYQKNHKEDVALVFMSSSGLQILPKKWLELYLKY